MIIACLWFQPSWGFARRHGHQSWATTRAFHFVSSLLSMLVLFQGMKWANTRWQGNSTQVSDPLSRLELTPPNSIKQVVRNHLLNWFSWCGLEVSWLAPNPDVVEELHWDSRRNKTKTHKHKWNIGWRKNKMKQKHEINLWKINESFYVWPTPLRDHLTKPFDGIGKWKIKMYRNHFVNHFVFDFLVNEKSKTKNV